MKKWIWWVAGAALVVCAVILFLSWRASRRAASTAAAPTAAEIARPSVAPAIANPVPDASGAAGGALPTLESSDKPLHDALAEITGERVLDELIRPEMLLRHIVVTIDNLPRKRAAVELRPTKPVPGQFLANGDEQSATLDSANYARYTPYVRVAQRLDAQRVGTLYFHYYPLFQEAYQSLGYPNGYFNDRLVATIDDMLATPDVTGPIALTRPNVTYQYADPKLEALSAGQKLLLRMGPENAAVIKAKLRELRATVATHHAG
jgi:hypothetical protein